MAADIQVMTQKQQISRTQDIIGVLRSRDMDFERVSMGGNKVPGSSWELRCGRLLGHPARADAGDSGCADSGAAEAITCAAKVAATAAGKPTAAPPGGVALARVAVNLAGAAALAGGRCVLAAALLDP
mmetsp:Transcript_25922/g.76827  ORF Transcript_25922/g.76827 Transcript_25922/m.76827 type:complete len:128 (+) Transcript_25922:639-1022(+)|eukprot:36187-Chlamydomonas_euryale.AAC.4